MLDLEDNEFEKNVFNNEKPVLVYFWATWCGPCKLLTLLLKEIENKFKNDLEIYCINIENNKVVMTQYEVKNVPTIILFQNGAVLSMKVGAITKKQLINLIERNINLLEK